MTSGVGYSMAIDAASGLFPIRLLCVQANKDGAGVV